MSTGKWKSFLLETLYFMGSYFLLSWLLFDRSGLELIFESIFIGGLSGFASITIFPRMLKAVMIPVAAKLERSVSAPALEDDEQVLLDEGANHFKGIERVGGKLALTNKRLLFRSHKFNIQNHIESILLSQIASVEKGKHSSGNVVRVNLKDGQAHFFGVISPPLWVETLSNQISLMRDEADAEHSA
jgi:hypothetical protein